jgi:methylglutaconyl-CoA hydratase
MNNQALTLSTDTRGIATLTLNRADKHNAFDDELIKHLTTLFEQLAVDDAVRVVLLTATGKSFSAGADLNWMKRMATYSKQENLADATALATMLRTLNELPKPTIARVQGAAFGGGVGLISCCDIAVASERASFCLSEVKLGLVPATISPYVIAAIGERAARRYFTTAERFSAATALRIGLISEQVKEDALDAEIEQIINTLLANGPKAITIAKQLVADVTNRPIDDAMIVKTSELIASVRSSDEAKEGLSAFLSKRKANWTVS